MHWKKNILQILFQIYSIALTTNLFFDRANNFGEDSWSFKIKVGFIIIGLFLMSWYFVKIKLHFVAITYFLTNIIWIIFAITSRYAILFYEKLYDFHWEIKVLTAVILPLSILLSKARHYNWLSVFAVLYFISSVIMELFLYMEYNSETYVVLLIHILADLSLIAHLVTEKKTEPSYSEEILD